jgi:hypothetical protein
VDTNKNKLRGSAHKDRATRAEISSWPRLLDIHTAAAYSSPGESTFCDYVADRILQPVEMPGSTLRDKAGNVIAHAKDRRIAKILIDRADLDTLIDERNPRV